MRVICSPGDTSRLLKPIVGGHKVPSLPVLLMGHCRPIPLGQSLPSKAAAFLDRCIIYPSVNSPQRP
jgi:hypothetical protein